MCHLCPDPYRDQKAAELRDVQAKGALTRFALGALIGLALTCTVWEIMSHNQQAPVPADCRASVALTKRSLDALDECLASLKTCAEIP